MGAPVILKEDLSIRRGLTSKLSYWCTNTACEKDNLLSNPYSPKSKSLNVRSVLAMRTIGRGHSSLARRSVATRKMRYVEFISDGDSKTIAMLNAEKPYGDGVEVEKHECVGHIQKRVGNRVKAAKKDFLRDKAVYKKKVQELNEREKEVRKKYGLTGGKRGRGGKRGCDKVQKGVGEGSRGRSRGRGKGRGRGGSKGKGKLVEGSLVGWGQLQEGEKLLRALEEERAGFKVVDGVMLDGQIGALQQFYGNHIQRHAAIPDTDPHKLEAMYDDCWAVFYHCLSTDNNPRHYCCPRGESSWCEYQKALARGVDPPPANPRIPAAFEDYLKPHWESLCRPALLRKCRLGATQNRNESFNSLVWLHCPKTEYATSTTVQIAVSQAVIVFNSGKKSLLPVMDEVRIHFVKPSWPMKTLYALESLGSRQRYLRSSVGSLKGMRKGMQRMLLLLRRVSPTKLVEDSMRFDTYSLSLSLIQACFVLHLPSLLCFSVTSLTYNSTVLYTTFVKIILFRCKPIITYSYFYKKQHFWYHLKALFLLFQ